MSRIEKETWLSHGTAVRVRKLIESEGNVPSVPTVPTITDVLDITIVQMYHLFQVVFSRIVVSFIEFAATFPFPE